GSSPGRRSRNSSSALPARSSLRAAARDPGPERALDEEVSVTPAARSWKVSVGHRVGAEPWKIRFVELRGAQPGPATAIVAGIFGDKPLGCLAGLELERRLSGVALRGTVRLVPG